MPSCARSWKGSKRIWPSAAVERRSRPRLPPRNHLKLGNPTRKPN